MRIAGRIGIGLALATALLTSACAAGRHAQTDQERATFDGTYASVGKIDLRGLAIESPTGSTPYYPVGSDATVKLVLINNDVGPNGASDRLVSITTPAAQSWAAYGTIAQAQAAKSAATATPATPTTPATTPGGTTGQTAPATTGESISSGGTAATTPAPSALPSITVEPGQRVSFGVPDATRALLLVGLKQQLYPGSTIPLTFTFANAGKITIAVPVQLSTSPASSVLPVPSESA